MTPHYLTAEHIRRMQFTTDIPDDAGVVTGDRLIVRLINPRTGDRPDWALVIRERDYLDALAMDPRLVCPVCKGKGSQKVRGRGQTGGWVSRICARCVGVGRLPDPNDEVTDVD